MRVSCIIPTGNRRDLLPLAIKSFLAQDWPDKELVVIDDGEIPEEDLVAHVPGVVYVRTEKMSIGAKRNLACERASGEIIAHFDSDDWSAPDRVRDQVERLIRYDKQMTGYNSFFIWHTATERAFRFISDPHQATGTTMCYRRDFWKANPFPEWSFGETLALIFTARDQWQLVTADRTEKVVIRVHGKNTTDWEGHTRRNLVSRETLPIAFFEALQS